MPNDFTATLMDATKTMFFDVFKNKANVQPELAKTPITAPLMASKQMVKTEPLKVGAENCIGAKVYYLTADDVTESTVSDTAISSDCELAVGSSVSSYIEEYNNNVFIKENITVDDADCGNIVQLQDKIRVALPSKMTNMVQGLNNYFVNFIESNKTAPNAAYANDGLTIGGGGDYTITGADYWTGDKVEETLGLIEGLAADHGLHDYYIVTGTGLRLAKYVSNYNSTNVGTSKFGTNSAYGQFEIFFDPKYLDQIVTGTNLFIIDPRAYVFVPTNAYTPQTVATGDQYNTMKFSLPLQYFNQFDKDSNQLATFMYANDGNMSAAMIDVLYQKKCARDLDPNFKHRLQHTWELDLNGCLYMAPNTGVETGIIKIVRA